jgi:serine/threonine protein kinase
MLKRTKSTGNPNSLPLEYDEDAPEPSSDVEEQEEEALQQPQPTSVPTPANPQRVELLPADFLFGRTLGEGAFARVVHAKSKKTGAEFAIKIMEKRHIKKEKKVIMNIVIDELSLNINISDKTCCYGEENFNHGFSSLDCKVSGFSFPLLNLYFIGKLLDLILLFKIQDTFLCVWNL